jgi:MFS transporter, DHA3 family, macrolide efflux protein
MAQGISIFGDYLAMFAVQAAIVFRMRGSARAVTIVLLVSLLPAIAIGPIAGVFADRWNPRRTMIASDGVRAALVLLLAGCTAAPMGTLSRVLPRMACICFAISCVSALFVPAQAVMIPQLVKRDQLLSASALMQQTMHAARIASPAVAGALVTKFGENACYIADAASFVLSAALLATTSCGAPPAIGTLQPTHWMRDVHAGFKFVVSNSEIAFATFAMAGGTFAAGCYSALVAIYVRDVLHIAATSYAIIGSITAGGTLAGSLAVAKYAHRCLRQTLIAAGMGLVGISILMMAIAPSRSVAFGGALGIGCGAAVAMVAASAALKEHTPAALRGRVSSVSVAMMSAAQAAALLFAGSCAAWIGVRGVYALSAAMLLAQPVYRCFHRGTNRSVPSACFQSLP